MHLGFQLTVTALVYPALARVPAERWAAAHQAHSRTITVVVGVVYGALAVTGGWSLLENPGGWTLLAVAALAATGVTTGFAAQVHGRLGDRAGGHDDRLIARLLRIDRVRAATAVLAFVAAALATRGVAGAG